MRDIFFFQAEDGIRDPLVTGVQTCALPIWRACAGWPEASRLETEPVAPTDWRTRSPRWHVGAHSKHRPPTGRPTRGVGRSRKSLNKASREGAKYAPRGALRRQDLRRASPFRGAPRAGGLADLPEGAQRRAGPAHREAGFHL